VTGAVDEENSVALDDLLDDRVVEEAGELAMDVVCDADEEFELLERYVVDLDVLEVFVADPDPELDDVLILVEEAIFVVGLLVVLETLVVELDDREVVDLDMLRAFVAEPATEPDDVLGVIEEAILVAELLVGLLAELLAGLLIVLTEPEVELNEPTEPLGEEMADMVVGVALPLIDEELLFDRLGMTDAESEVDVVGKLLALDNGRLEEAGVLLGTIWLRGDEVVVLGRPLEDDRAIKLGPTKVDDEDTVLVERPELVLDRTVDELLDAGQIALACRARSRL
jgi:hypothetical protein